jgi:hypothetical protein
VVIKPSGDLLVLKVRALQLKEGNNNTKFNHRLANSHRSNHVEGLEGGWGEF